MQLRSTASSTVLCVSLRKAKTHLRLSTGPGLVDETDLKGKLRAAIGYVENEVVGARAFRRRTYRGILDDFPGNGGEIELPIPPLYSSTTLSVTYYDSTGALQTLSSTVYDLVAPSNAPARLSPKSGESWPAVDQRPDAVQILWDAGLGSTASMPDLAREAALMKLEQLWDPERLARVDVDGAIGRLMNGQDYGHY